MSYKLPDWIWSAGKTSFNIISDVDYEIFGIGATSSEISGELAGSYCYEH